MTIPKNAETTRFEIVLRADVNGVARTYYWCPGSPGRLVHQPADAGPLDDEPPPEPPC